MLVVYLSNRYIRVVDGEVSGSKVNVLFRGHQGLHSERNRHGRGRVHRTDTGSVGFQSPAKKRRKPGD